tara:strand:- start:12 stop:506 length:495 start_codon:yes stop_codon:yes gene_type:complete
MGKISKNKILVELINNQIDNIDNKKKLDVRSLQRISRNIDDSIFGDKCVIWQGYITYIESTKVHYVNFFFDGKKHALHRLLYLNFIGDVKANEYLKYSCNNKGKCCNINHIYKINSKKTLDFEKKNQLENNKNSENLLNKTVKKTLDNENLNVINKGDKLIIIF